jgi:hypothetical protein
MHAIHSDHSLVEAPTAAAVVVDVLLELLTL